MNPEKIVGMIKHIGARVVTIVTPDDATVYIPHSKIWSDLIHNANSHTPNLLGVANFYLDPNHNPEQICKILKNVALASPFTNLAQPVVVFLEEKPWFTHYRIKAYPMDPRQQFQFISDLTARGKQSLGALSVKFANLSTEHAFQENN